MHGLHGGVLMTATLSPVLFDSREQTPWEALPGVVMQRVTMAEGDYTTEKLQGIAVIERKSVADFASSITHGRERFDDEIRRLHAYKWKAIIVEGNVDEVWRNHKIHVHAIIGSCASFMARADCPALFGGTRPAAARLAFGILRRWEERIAAEEGGK